MTAPQLPSPLSCSPRDRPRAGRRPPPPAGRPARSCRSPARARPRRSTTPTTSTTARQAGRRVRRQHRPGRRLGRDPPERAGRDRDLADPRRRAVAGGPHLPERRGRAVDRDPELDRRRVDLGQPGRLAPADVRQGAVDAARRARRRSGRASARRTTSRACPVRRCRRRPRPRRLHPPGSFRQRQRRLVGLGGLVGGVLLTLLWMRLRPARADEPELDPATDWLAPQSQVDLRDLTAGSRGGEQLLHETDGGRRGLRAVAVRRARVHPLDAPARPGRPRSAGLLEARARRPARSTRLRSPRISVIANRPGTSVGSRISRR